MVDQNMSKNLISSYKKKEQENGTVMIPFTEEINPIKQEILIIC